MNLAISGLGIVYLPDFTVQSAIENGQLKEILHTYQPEKLPMHIIYPSKKHLNKKMKVVIDHIHKILSE